jgi:uncharacterized protein (DUF1499 family)
MSDSVDHPLPPCPGTPNCEREEREFSVDPGVLFGAVQSTLADMGPVEMNVQPSDRSVRAVFRVALLFKDDVDVVIQPNGATGDKSRLHIRSASRVGKSDLGVNRRRVNRFFRRLDDRL